jgi:acetolactate synthase-1/3 small subunit
MRHIISILLQNEAGALARVAGMFSARGYNIESLTVAPTHDPLLSRLTLVTSGSDAVIDQIVKQSRKLIDVVDVQDLTARKHIEYELALVKLAINADNAAAVVETARRHHGLMLDESDDTRTIQVTGSGMEVSEAIDALQAQAVILEIVRSGVAAIEPGEAVLGVEVFDESVAAA